MDGTFTRTQASSRYPTLAPTLALRTPTAMPRASMPAALLILPWRSRRRRADRASVTLGAARTARLTSGYGISRHHLPHPKVGPARGPQRQRHPFRRKPAEVDR